MEYIRDTWTPLPILEVKCRTGDIQNGTEKTRCTVQAVYRKTMAFLRKSGLNSPDFPVSVVFEQVCQESLEWLRIYCQHTNEERSSQEADLGCLNCISFPDTRRAELYHFECMNTAPPHTMHRT